MAITKTPYGLVYNEDGSLCYTERLDDVPFDGIASWAVEEGTTNLLDSLWSTTYYTAITPPDGFAKAGRITVGTSGSPFGYVGSQTNIPAQPNTDYTLSYYARVVKGKNTLVNGTQIYIGSDSQGTQGVAIQQIYNELDYNWKRFVITGQTDGDATKLTRATFRIQTDQSEECIVEIADWQLEQKPYATSFVDGTRAGGKLTLPLTFTTNNIISYYVKLSLTSTLGDGIYLLNIRKDIQNRLGVKLKNTDVLDIFFIKGNTVIFEDNLNNFGWLRNSWHLLQVVIDKTTLAIKFYIDSNLIASYTVTDTELSFFSGNINTYLGCYGPLDFPSFRYMGALISNFYVGHYRDKNGNVIWTDEYIKNLYHMRKPFNSRVLKGGR